MVIGVTGHRDFRSENFRYERFLEILVVSKVQTIITGGALGFDNHIGHIARKLQIDLNLYLPYKGFCKDEKLLEWASFVGQQAEKYTGKHLYYQRNQLIVDHCDLLIGYHDGRNTGGTTATIKYAQQKGLAKYNVYKNNK